MPTIVSIEENVSMEPTSSTEKVSTDHHCPESSISKDTIEQPSVLQPILRHPIRCYSYHDSSSSTDKRLHRVPSSDRPSSVTSPVRISTPVNIISGMVERAASANETSLSFRSAALERALENIDLVPKLLIRQTRQYLQRTLKLTGRVFPNWLVPPDFRCVHCFTCDQVYTPEHFMIHTDEDDLSCEKPIKVSPIQLLESERQSSEKVRL